METGDVSDVLAGDQRNARQVPHWAKIIGIVLPLLASVAAIVGGISGIGSVRANQAELTPYANGRLTQGTVILVTTTCFRSCTYQPTIRYAVGASMYTIKAPFQGDEPSMGDHVQLSYEASSPARARDISEAPSSWDLPLFTAYFLLGIGTLLMLTILWLLLRIWTRSGRQPAA